MPRKSYLPTADELFMCLCNGDRDEVLQRPPWACLASPELAHDWLRISVQVLWTYKLRRNGPEPEADSDARRLYREVGRRTLYRFDSVLSWLPGGADRPIHSWAHRWLRLQGREIEDDPRAVVAEIGVLEGDPRVRRRPFTFRKLDAGLEHLRRCYGASC